ncbi:MAG TPA: hydrogenase expression/formation protein HypE [Candidatus Acidoferrales bacterium]|nr:hydrogenase expression/formation protein HypE [Candidatus Acidoferrales bacterium]
MEFNPSCPIPIAQYPHVLLAHGGGGRLMHQLIDQMFLAAFRNPLLETRHDSTVVELTGEKLAFTTDSYVVRPLFFPGGDVGSMAVHGTVNDLAMSGARPLYLSAAFIIEEGLPMETLWRIACSMRGAAERCRVQIITGDTKVVDKGKGDGVFINTAGLGLVEHGRIIAPSSVQPGDAILVSGDLGRHGMAIMAVREGLRFESAIQSDSAPVHEIVLELLKAGIEIHCLRDLTRGGLAGALNEIAEAARVRIEVEEKSIPVREDVHAACEMLGLDPLHVACEGRFIAFVAAKDQDRALPIMRGHATGAGSAVIGRVAERAAPLVTLKSAIGVSRILDMPSGEQLPRIC